jgi:hypothetical protein
LDQGERTGAAHRNGQKRARVNDGVANCEDGEVFEELDLSGHSGGGVEFGFFDRHS